MSNFCYFLFAYAAFEKRNPQYTSIHDSQFLKVQSV